MWHCPEVPKGEPTGRMALVDGRDEHEPAGGRFFWKGPSPRLGCRRDAPKSFVLGAVMLALATDLMVVLRLATPAVALTPRPQPIQALPRCLSFEGHLPIIFLDEHGFGSDEQMFGAK